MSSLTDRYVHAATRFVQAEDERTELGLELRERIADTTAALEGTGLEPAAAERQALVDLGDPLKLSAEYRQKPLYLIGPRYYYTWLRVLVIAVATSAPIVGVIYLISEISAQATVGEAIGGTLGTALSVATHAAFWVTLFFAVAERVAPQISGSTWNPDLLPQVPDESKRGHRCDFVASVVMLVIAIALLVWQQLAPPFVVDGYRVPVLDPALWLPWLALLIVLLVAELAHAVWLYRAGWTWPVAVANAAIAIGTAAVVLPLLLADRLLNPELTDLLGWTGQTALGSRIAAAVVIAITVWDVAAGFVKAARSGRRA